MISNAKRPNPAPGTKTRIDALSSFETSLKNSFNASSKGLYAASLSGCPYNIF
jgi:hypothetical protein